MSKAAISNVLSEINRAIKLCGKGRHQDALKLCKQIAQPLPNDLEIRVQYGVLSISLGDYATAIKILKRVVADKPENGIYLGLLGDAYLQNLQFEDATKILTKSLELEPDYWKTLADYGALLLAQYQFQEAINYFERAIKLKPSNIAINTNFATCLANTGQHHEALVFGARAIELNPKNPDAYDIMGCALTELGRTQEAERYFEKAIKINKYFGAVYLNYSRAKKFSDKDLPLMRKMEKYLLESMPSDQRRYFHFSLGKLYDDCKEWDKAFQHYRQANLLARPSYEESPIPKKSLKRLKKLFTQGMLEHYSHEIGNQSTVPVFVVGMPRTGTTLVEQIISSHPQAEGAGELDNIDQLSRKICPIEDHKEYVEKWKAALTSETFKKIASEYLEVLTKDRGNALRIIDKMPENYLHLGLIKLLFPQAKIIHMIRNPLDTCISCYFTTFRHIGWSYDIEWIVKRYAQYQKVMKFWKSVLPEEMILEIEYERLVTEPEKYSRLMINHIGLEWDSVCLDFYKKEQAVRTASLWQVRQPIYESSMKRWQNYIPFLEAFVSPLTSFLDEDDKRVLVEAGLHIKPKRWWN